MKILVISGHPDISKSTVSRTWLEQIEAHTNDVRLHVLSKTYKDANFDIEAERALLTQAERIVLLYPFYWFDTPWLVQKWLEEVFTFDFYFNQKAMVGKEFQVAISMGGPEEFYTLGGLNSYPVDFYLTKMQGFAHKCQMTYRPHYALYTSHSEDITYRLVQEQGDFVEWVTKV